MTFRCSSTRRNRVGPELGAVAAHPPALRLEATFLGGCLQTSRRKSDFEILGRVEFGKMLTDDLLSAVALDAFSAAIPAGDVAPWVEHIDSVVDHSIDEQPEALLAIR